MMSDIAFVDVSSNLQADGVVRPHLRDVTLTLPRGRVALLGANQHDCVATINLLCRKGKPFKGHIAQSGSVSWPIGRTASFAGATKGTDVISYLATLYGFERDLARSFMEEQFAHRAHLATRMDRWTPRMRAEFGLLAALLPPFDIYLIDGNIVLQDDPDFTLRYLEMLSARVGNRTLVMSTRQVPLLRTLATSFAVIEDQSIELVDTCEEALERVRLDATRRAGFEAADQEADDMDEVALP